MIHHLCELVCVRACIWLICLGVESAIPGCDTPDHRPLTKLFYNTVTFNHTHSHVTHCAIMSPNVNEPCYASFLPDSV